MVVEEKQPRRKCSSTLVRPTHSTFPGWHVEPVTEIGPWSYGFLSSRSRDLRFNPVALTLERITRKRHMRAVLEAKEPVPFRFHSGKPQLACGFQNHRLI